MLSAHRLRILVAGNDVTHGRCLGLPFDRIDRNPSGTLRGRLAQHTLDDLGPGALGADVLDQLSDCGITAVHRTRQQHPCPAIRIDHGSHGLRFHGARLFAAPHGQCDGQLVVARYITARKIGNGPGQSKDD